MDFSNNFIAQESLLQHMGPGNKCMQLGNSVGSEHGKIGLLPGLEASFESPQSFALKVTLLYLHLVNELIY